MQKERAILSNANTNLELNLTQFSPVMQSPLQAFNLSAKQEKMTDAKGVWAHEIPLLGYISLRGNAQNKDFLAAVKKVTGSSLPTQACSLSSASTLTILNCSPDEWMIVCPREQRATLQQALQVSLVGVHSQVLDNSGGYTSVLLQGKQAADVLQHCTVYNLHALTPNKVVGTTFGKASVILYRLDDGFCLVLRRSFADYIWRYLARAAAPYGFGITKT
jgi:sarcosine oxidase, subunit gamma